MGLTLVFSELHVLLSDLWEKGMKEEERIREGGKEGIEKECKEGRKKE